MIGFIKATTDPFADIKKKGQSLPFQCCHVKWFAQELPYFKEKPIIFNCKPVF